VRPASTRSEEDSPSMYKQFPLLPLASAMHCIATCISSHCRKGCRSGANKSLFNDVEDWSIEIFGITEWVLSKRGLFTLHLGYGLCCPSQGAPPAVLLDLFPKDRKLVIRDNSDPLLLVRPQPFLWHNRAESAGDDVLSQGYEKDPYRERAGPRQHQGSARSETGAEQYRGLILLSRGKKCNRWPNHKPA